MHLSHGDKIAAVDEKNTGLFPIRGYRVVEIAAVHVISVGFGLNNAAGLTPMIWLKMKKLLTDMQDPSVSSKSKGVLQ